MFVVIILVAAAILAGVVAVALGRGGELARSRPDWTSYPDFRTWADVASYRPPPALLGYQAAATEHALALIARAIAERDAEIEWLRDRLAEARREAMMSGGPAAEADAQAAVEPVDTQTGGPVPAAPRFAGPVSAGPVPAGPAPADPRSVGSRSAGTGVNG